MLRACAHFCANSWQSLREAWADMTQNAACDSFVPAFECLDNFAQSQVVPVPTEELLSKDYAQKRKAEYYSATKVGSCMLLHVDRSCMSRHCLTTFVKI